MTHDELLTRGVAKTIPHALAEEKIQSGKKLRIYLGIDPTGTHLHLGHSVVLRKLKQFSEAGHQVTFLIGSFTAMIGDPSGRDALREPLTKEQVEKNFLDYKAQAEKILDFSKIDIRYNHEWLEKLEFAEIVQLASNFTMQQMVQRDMFQRRINEDKPIGVHEFLYPLMVGYDSIMLDVDCEVGGSDQEFNMLAGRTLQHAYGKREKFVLTAKLIEGIDGRKMSKTYDNCIYLTDEPKDMFGKTLSIKDENIALYMECCTDIPMAEIAEAEKAMKKGSNPKEFKVRLAKELVTMYHGKEAADAAEEEFTRIFSKGGVPDEMPSAKPEKGESLIELLVRTKLIASKSEGRRLVEQQGIHMNDLTVNDIETQPQAGIVKVGKRKFLKIL